MIIYGKTSCACRYMKQEGIAHGPERVPDIGSGRTEAFRNDQSRRAVRVPIRIGAVPVSRA
ncbi:hypothetical protein B8V81_1662 [Paenibacillus pasadenensis]|uniref:Uncharacterized protein n=1 Tax=Paenibacillus pasadenensis TaxID=217090 RepID=A0A2N5NAT8_9BACL|nr:hypothetical protein B8V81_1662 [Paenibacillus pasadenensis]